jgi:hypothetical protein
MCASNSRGRVKAAPGGVVGGPTPVVDELKMSVYVRGLRRIKAVARKTPRGVIGGCCMKVEVEVKVQRW